MGLPTITSQLRYIDRELGMLPRWVFLAIWLHLFLFQWS